MDGYKRLHYSPFDILVMLSGIICIILGTYFFVSPTDQSGQFRDFETFGIIKDGVGTRKLNNSLQWFEINKNYPLYYGDVIFANNSKDIEIELADKESSLVVPEDSMIKITKSGDEFDLNVSQGSIQFKTKGSKKINLRNKAGTIRTITISKDSNIKISTNKSNVVVEAVSGSAKLTRIDKASNKVEDVAIEKNKILVVGRKNAEVMEKENIVSVKSIDPLFDNRLPIVNKYKNLASIEVSKSRKFEKIQKLLIDDRGIDISRLVYGKYFIRTDNSGKMDSFELENLKPMRINIEKRDSYFPGDKLRITWDGRKGLTYKLQILDEKPIEMMIQGNQYSYTIVDGDDIVFKISEPRFKRESNKILSFQISKLLEIIDIKEIQIGNKMYRNLFLKNPRAIEYNIKVFDKRGDVYVNRNAKTETFLMKIEKPGAYDIKMMNLADKKILVERSFTIKDRITNAQEQKVFYSTGKDLSANLKWQRGGNIPENMEYVIKIFKEGNKDKPIIEKKTKDTNYVYKAKNEETFFWKIESTIPDLIDSSKLFETKVARPKFEKLSAPRIILKYIKNKKCYAFSIPKAKYAESYDVYIFSSRSKVNENRKAMYHKVLSGTSDCLPAKDLLVFEGKYFYKYKILDRWKRESPYSPVGMMFFPISPLEKL